jgi:ribosomal protein L37AE/L43A
VIVLTWLRRLVFGPRIPGSSNHASRSRPDDVESREEVERFGVDWEVVTGHGASAADQYAYAEDPKCPDCGTDVVPETREGRLGGETEIWRCPSCGYTTERPADHLFHEHGAVERIVDGRLRAAG